MPESNAIEVDFGTTPLPGAEDADLDAQVEAVLADADPEEEAEPASLSPPGELPWVRMAGAERELTRAGYGHVAVALKEEHGTADDGLARIEAFEGEVAIAGEVVQALRDDKEATRDLALWEAQAAGELGAGWEEPRPHSAEAVEEVRQKLDGIGLGELVDHFRDKWGSETAANFSYMDVAAERLGLPTAAVRALVEQARRGRVRPLIRAGEMLAKTGRLIVHGG